MVNRPALSVEALRSNALTGLRIWTVAFVTTAPVGSFTVPVTDVELPPDCARAQTPKAEMKITAKAASRDFFEEASMIPPKENEVAQ